MNTQFDEWLRQLAAAQKGGVTFPAATRGRQWLQNIILPGDWTGYDMKAQVRLYPDAPGDPLATCAVNGPYLVDGDTTFQLRLDAASAPNSTGSLPADSELEGIVQFAIDILLTPKTGGGAPELLMGGVLPLLGRVTA